MLSVLIVDDEKIVRDGLKKIIDWPAHGYEVCGDAADGNEALDMIRRHQPDLVLLDIKMPGLTGIEVLKALAEEEWRPATLILSGFSDFDFARDALNLGARGYITKPVDEDQLAAKVDEIARETLDDRRIRERLDAAGLLAWQRRIAAVLASANVQAEGAPEGADEQDGENATSRSFQVAVLSPELCGFARSSAALIKVAEEGFAVLKDILIQDGRLIIVFRDESELTVKRYLEQLHKRVEQSSRRRDGRETRAYAAPIGSQGTERGAVPGMGAPIGAVPALGAIAALGPRLRGWEGLRESYRLAAELEGDLFFHPDTPFVSMADRRDAVGSAEPPDAARLAAFIEIYDLDKVGAFFAELEKDLCQTSPTAEAARNECIAFIMELRTLLEGKHPEKDIFSEPLAALIKRVTAAPYLHDLLSAIRETVVALAGSFNDSLSGNTIVKVIQYVQRNYNTDLKLEGLGNLFNCNSAYLGKRFKEETGESFNSYMDHLRIDAAKDLLKNSSLKIYEISHLVGYSNADYFYAKFRKYAGMTPRSFKIAETGESGDEGDEGEGRD